MGILDFGFPLTNQPDAGARAGCFSPMAANSKDEMVSAIARPALQEGLRVDPDLISRLVADMTIEAGALPLMQFALDDLFHYEHERSSGCGSRNRAEVRNKKSAVGNRSAPPPRLRTRFWLLIHFNLVAVDLVEDSSCIAVAISGGIHDR